MKNYITYSIMLGLAVALLFSIQRCRYNAAVKINALAALTDTLTYFTNREGMQTASITTLEADKKALKILVLNKDSRLAAMAHEFSGVHTAVKYKTGIWVDTVYVAYKVPLDTLPDFERTGAVSDKWYAFNYKADNAGITLSDVSVQTETAVITGTKRKWFLGKETLTTDVTNTNPYVKITDLKAAEVVLPTPIYKKWYIWLAAGVAGGFLMAK